MTKDEKIEIMFESILSEIEEIKGYFENRNIEKVQNDKDDLSYKFEAIKDHLYNIKIPTYHNNFLRMEAKINDLVNAMGPVEQDHSTGSLLKRRNQLVSILLMISIILNMYFLWKLFV